ncbi:MAG TPA: dihydrofolate reductase family protein [Gammaproteobacteria bacterium]|nr:dihydrofolate reductase family protein [Gammaproteobacteria bacterium]
MTEAHRLTRLFPLPTTSVAHKGCYLSVPLVEPHSDDLFLYANFVSSLDGRIALADADSGKQSVPGATANSRDWRLFQELAAHADILITSGRYLRQFAAGTAQDMLPVGTADGFADIRAWRREHGLKPQPDVAVLSSSLDFTVPAILQEQGRRVHVFTAATAPDRLRRMHERAGAQVHTAAEIQRVAGEQIKRELTRLGYRRAYCVTGPCVVHTFLAAGVLDALFLTTVHTILGGEDFSTIAEGAALSPPADYALTWLYHDAEASRGGSQTFARYDRRG